MLIVDSGPRSIASLDHRHVASVRPGHINAFTLVP
jgi:hypothetical protein